MFGLRPFFFADYRDIRDALNSSKLKITNDFLLQFLGKRGLIFSRSASRLELIEAVSTYAYEASDLDEICDQLEVKSRPDRVAYTTLVGSIDDEIIKKAFEKFKSERKSKNEKIQTDQTAGDGLEIQVDYYEMHPGRTALKQMQPKQGLIKIMKVGDEIRIRHPANEHMEDIVSGLEETIKELLPEGEKLKSSSIDLSSLSKIQRTLFFQEVIKSIDGYRVYDVMKVNLNKDITSVDFSDDGEDALIEPEDTDASDAEDSENGTALPQRQLETEMRAVLKKASLDGSGILHAAELKKFLESGFFISRIVWAVRPRTKKEAQPKVEFEASLANPAEGTGFAYNIRGIYRAKRNKTYNITRMLPDAGESAKLLADLENSIKKSYEKIAFPTT